MFIYNLIHAQTDVILFCKNKEILWFEIAVFLSILINPYIFVSKLWHFIC